MKNYFNKEASERLVKMALIRGRCRRVLKEVEAIKRNAEKIGVKNEK